MGDQSPLATKGKRDLTSREETLAVGRQRGPETLRRKGNKPRTTDIGTGRSCVAGDVQPIGASPHVKEEKRKSYQGEALSRARRRTPKVLSWALSALPKKKNRTCNRRTGHPVGRTAKGGKRLPLSESALASPQSHLPGRRRTLKKKKRGVGKENEATPSTRGGGGRGSHPLVFGALFLSAKAGGSEGDRGPRHRDTAPW